MKSLTEVSARRFGNGLVLATIVLSAILSFAPSGASAKVPLTETLGNSSALVGSNISFYNNSTILSVQDGFSGVMTTWTSPLPTPQAVDVWFVAYTPRIQVVFVSFAQLAFAAHGSNTLFQAFSSALPSGIYTVEVFLLSTFGTALSYTARVNISL